MDEHKRSQPVPVRRFLRKCKSSLFRPKIADSSGANLTGGKLLAGTLVFKRRLARVLSDDENMVGLLLPPSAGGALANAAVTMMNKVAVNLNYTMDEATVNYCIGQCEIKHVVTSRRFLEKRPYDLDAELIYLEDLKDQASGTDRAVAAAQAYLVPSALLDRMHRLNDIDAEDLLTVIFTSGSTGEPKGVMLSHHNILSNINAVDELFHITRDDVLLGILPFFHSFGFTATLWLPPMLQIGAVYHPNPLDSRVIGVLVQQYAVSLMVATPTFLQA
ncbi:MAG: AMP-binding protein, partial [Planctomycetaceae bacterium]